MVRRSLASFFVEYNVLQSMSARVNSCKNGQRLDVSRGRMRRIVHCTSQCPGPGSPIVRCVAVGDIGTFHRRLPMRNVGKGKVHIRNRSYCVSRSV